MGKAENKINNKEDKQDSADLNTDKEVENAQDSQSNKTQESVEDIKKLLQNKEKECLEWSDKYLRLCADFDNARKRWDRDRDQIFKFAKYPFLQEILVVLDEMEQGIKMVKTHANVEEITKGLEIMCNNFKNILVKNGLQPIETINKIFDPHVHEMVATKEIEDPNIEEHTVLEEVQKGYMFEDKVLRTAKVIIGVKKNNK